MTIRDEVYRLYRDASDFYNITHDSAWLIRAHAFKEILDIIERGVDYDN